MQKLNASLCTAGEEPKRFGRKGKHSVLQRTKKGILALGIAVFAFSSVLRSKMIFWFSVKTEGWFLRKNRQLK